MPQIAPPGYEHPQVGTSDDGRLVENLAQVTVLDYPGAKLYMEVGNLVEAAWRARACDKEPWTVAFIEACPPGAWFVDVGASTGPYTLVAISRDLNVLAIEPAFESYRRLCRNLAQNQMLDRAVVLPIALGATMTLDWMHFYDIRAGAGSNRIGGAVKQTWHKQLVMCYPLDAVMQMIVADAPIYIKLDVDGGESGVLDGMSETLANPLLRGMMVEMPLSDEHLIVARIEAAGLKLVQRYDERSGKRIADVAYGEFRRD